MDKKIKLLILTQKVDLNDDLLGFFHDWLNEFAKHCEQLIAVCLERGAYQLPANVKVKSLGKESGGSKIHYILNFYKYIWQERKNYDAVFVHMNLEYVLLGGFLWKLWHKPVGLWYVHREVSRRLALAEKLVKLIFTAAKESFRLSSRKVKIVGHGIDIKRFNPAPPGQRRHDSLFNIIYVGRISQIKNQALLIKSLGQLVNQRQLKQLRLDLVGAPVYGKDNLYLAQLKKLIREKKLGDYINFSGRVANQKIIEKYRLADLSVNLCPTGGVDKAVLESMACGLPVIVLNKAFSGILSGRSKQLILDQPKAGELSDKIVSMMRLETEAREKLGLELRQLIAANFSLSDLIKKIINYYHETASR